MGGKEQEVCHKALISFTTPSWTGNATLERAAVLNTNRESEGSANSLVSSPRFGATLFNSSWWALASSWGAVWEGPAIASSGEDEEEEEGIGWSAKSTASARGTSAEAGCTSGPGSDSASECRRLLLNVFHIPRTLTGALATVVKPPRSSIIARGLATGPQAMQPLVARTEMPMRLVGGLDLQAGLPPHFQSLRRGKLVWGTRMVPMPPVYPVPVGPLRIPQQGTCTSMMALGAASLVTSSGVWQIGDGTPVIDTSCFESSATPWTRSKNGNERIDVSETVDVPAIWRQDSGDKCLDSLEWCYEFGD
ncbi:hypothetical protein UY3_04872 [Chelonia mydas]|uniref:Uncharacterized protein n=1 Tax=Chelonia mydas TaxID=8469 RepID=M7CB84_CHEMY|nr:hypothetical protein UY3_04872 [Chelonia mydas]